MFDDELLYRVTVKVNGAPATPELKTLPLHKKNPDVGQKQTVYLDTILLEQEDAQSFADNEEVCKIKPKTFVVKADI